KRKKFFKRSVYPITAYFCLLCALFLILSFYEDGIQAILFIPLLCLLLSIAVSLGILCFFQSKGLYIMLGSAVGLALLATLICMGVHFASGDAAENNWLTNDDVESLALYISAAISAIALATPFFLCKEKETKFDSKSITFAAVCIAMSFALSYMRIVRLPQGGSITPASLLPLMVYAYIFGVRKGIFAGFTYGLLQALQDPSVLHPAQFLLDYPMAFAWIGLAGVFAKTKKLEKLPQLQFALGGILAGLGRFAMHFLSGAFAFGYWAPEGTPVLLYSFLYQAGYVLPDLILAILAGVALFSSASFTNETRRLQAK
ncbi:MAG: energy-coupled thiamine transporter ThiT, partial [Clostridia bacterium]|nr:energy-coupled thiamine transporter ThiT [Clostridia bacterium]